MKALTLWQPWASAIALGKKTIETRSWATSYRGPLAIHAAKRPMDVEELLLAGEGLGVYDLPLGVVVAVAELVDVVSTTGYRTTLTEHRWGNFTAGRFGWVLANVRPLDPPVPARGAQGLWEWPGP